ncbi:MAG: hypothetical protein GQ580_03270 [Candidatus Thorarchaeota archaeon]|nr:hypothetical protein [Candidatus Thorarchaeota archaeon]
MVSFTRSVAYPWALTGVFGAVHLVVTIIPYSLSIGGGGVISFGLVSGAIIGFLLGPFFGTIAVLIGSTAGGFVNPSIALFGLLTPLAPATGAFVAGSFRVRGSRIKSVAPVLFVYILALCFFILGPIGIYAPGYLWLHIVAVILVLLFMVPGVGPQLSDALHIESDSKHSHSFFAILLVSFIAVMADHLVGSTIAAYVFSAGMDPEALALIFMGVAFIYPWERLLASIITAVVLFITSISLAKTYFDLPTLPGIHSAPLEIPPEELEELSG